MAELHREIGSGAAETRTGTMRCQCSAGSCNVYLIYHLTSLKFLAYLSTWFQYGILHFHDYYIKMQSTESVFKDVFI